jgi:hypothetical protein
MENIETLAQELYDAKRAEDAATAARISVEERIAALIETGDNGSKTVEAGALKVTVKRALSYKADLENMRLIAGAPIKFVPAKAALDDKAFEKLRESNPALFATVLDEKAYEKLRTSDPALFATVAEFVTVTPRKVSVELKLA